MGNTAMPTVQTMGMHTIIAAYQIVRWKAPIHMGLVGLAAVRRLENTAMAYAISQGVRKQKRICTTVNTVMPTVQMMGMHTIIVACQVAHRWRAIHTIPAGCQVVQIWEAIHITLAGYRAAHRLENIAMEKEVGVITSLVMEMAIIKS